MDEPFETAVDKTDPGGRDHWRWTLASGLFTLLLAVVAFLLPDIRLLPRGGVVGSLLLLAGIAEAGFGFGRRRDRVGQAAIGSGLLTAFAGLLFVTNPGAGYFSISNLVIGWLLFRGLLILAMTRRVELSRSRMWLAVTGLTDVVLALVLIAGLPVSNLVVTLFGPTREIVARFAWILAASFAVTGIAQVAIAFSQRKDGATG
jgi:uncharacterized membrane protein HdeD (DUF308 family)